MSGCCAYGCRNRQEYKVPGITFHLFPKDPARRRAWTAAVKRKNFVPTDFTKLCSEHFEEGCFDRTKKKVRLLADAVPSIFKTQSISSSGIETLTEFQNNGSVFKRSLSESDEEEEEDEEDDDENLFLNENEEEDDHEHSFGSENDDDDEHLFVNENDEQSTSSSSESSVEESEPEAAPETEVVYVSEEAPDANKPSIIKIVPERPPRPTVALPQEHIRKALDTYSRVKPRDLEGGSEEVSLVLLQYPPTVPTPQELAELPPETLNEMYERNKKDLKALRQKTRRYQAKIARLERIVRNFDRCGSTEEEEVDDVYQQLLESQEREEFEEEDEET